MIRVISGDNELSALEFQKHYRSSSIHVLDPLRKLEQQYNRDGWPFLMLVDPQGQVVFGKTALLAGETRTILPLLDKMKAARETARTLEANGTRYAAATLERSGEASKPLVRDRFCSISAGPDGRVAVAFTRTGAAPGSDVILRVFDGRQWDQDRPIAATDADEFDPCVTYIPEGGLWVCWTSNASSSNYNIHVAALKTAKDEVRPERVTNAADDAMRGRLACDSAGNVWLSYYEWRKMGGFSRDKEVYARRHREGRWSEAVQVSPTDVPAYEDHSDPVIAACGKGVVVAWSWDYHQPKGYPRNCEAPTIFARTLAPDMTLGPSLAVSGHGIDMTPAIAATPSGGLWLAWDQLGALPGGVEGKGLSVRQIPDLSSQPAADHPIQTLRPGLGNICTPSLASNKDGMTALVWAETPDGEKWTLKRMDTKTGRNEWSEPSILSADGNPRWPAIAYDSTGRLWVAYSREQDGGRKVVVESYPAVKAER